MVGVLDGEKSLVIILFKPLYLPRVLPTLGSLIILLPLAGAKESSSGGLLTICPSSAECWRSAGSAMGRQAMLLEQGLARGAAGPTDILTMSSFLFQARDAPHSFLSVQKCTVHLSQAQTPKSGITYWLTGPQG